MAFGVGRVAVHKSIITEALRSTGGQNILASRRVRYPLIAMAISRHVRAIQIKAAL